MNCNSNCQCDSNLFIAPSANKLYQLSALGFNYDTLCDFNLILADAETHALKEECEKAKIQAYNEDYDRFYCQMENSKIQKAYSPMTFSSNNTIASNYDCFCGPMSYNESSTISNDVASKQKKKWLPAGKKADRSDPELRNLSNSYFWERRNILLQMLESYNDDEAILIKATPKAGKSSSSNIKDDLTEDSEKNLKSVKKSPKSMRGSIYRGVSKNKAKWQVMIMGNFKKMYFGAIDEEKDAALFYDKLAIVSHGIKARTNFDYTRRDIISILNEEGLSKAWCQ